MAGHLCAKPGAVQLVGKQHFFAAQRRHRYRRVKPFQHGREALVRIGQFFAHTLGLGDVGHRRHPAGLLAARIDQRRDIHACIKNGAALALDPDFKAARRRTTLQLVFQPGCQPLEVLFWPVRKGRNATDQLVFVPACHLAKSRVHISDATLQVECAHAGEHGVFHRAAEIRLSDQGLLGLHAAACVAPGAQQHPHRQGAECADQPEKTAADNAQRSAIALGSDQQAVAHRGDRNFILGGLVTPGQQPRR